ncbi:MAG: hypothetical protein Q8O87_00965 [bacterium]|nr:hypothetical protein [bacterium]
MKIKNFFITLLILLMVGQAGPTAVLAQDSNADLLSAIKQIVAEAVADLKTEIADLKNQITEQRAIIQTLGQESQETRRIATESSGPEVGQEVARQIGELRNELRDALLDNRDYRRGDSGTGIEGFQECLVEMGELSRADFNAGRGVYGPRTTAVISKLQRQYGFSETGVFDKQGRNALFLATQARGACGMPPGITFEELDRDDRPPTPAIIPISTQVPPSTPPTSSPQTSVTISSPSRNQVLTPGTSVTLRWEVQNASLTSWIVFKLVNTTSGSVAEVRERATAGSGAFTSTLIVPNTLAGGSYNLAADVYLGSNTNPEYLGGTTIPVTVGSGANSTTPTTPTTPTTQTPTTGPSAEDATTSGYKGDAFVSCMNGKGAAGVSALSMIHGWIDSGLLRSQFPWGQLTGDLANAVPSCESEAGITYFEYYGDTGSGDYAECTGKPDQASCSAAGSNCYWYSGDTPYCYYDSSGGVGTYGDCQGNSNESTCSAQPGCTWYDTFCQGDNYQSGSTNTSGSMQKCFYPNATIDGQAPGYTVWCEYDYYNCHQGDPTGAEVSLNGLMLGAPSSCESGYSGGSSFNNSPSQPVWQSLLSNTLNSMTQILQNIADLFR